MLFYDAIIHDVKLTHPDGTEFLVMFHAIGEWKLSAICPEPAEAQRPWLESEAWKEMRRVFGVDALGKIK